MSTSEPQAGASAPEEVMQRISEGIELSQRGEREQARALFTELWKQVGDDGDVLHRCALAHSMADVQDDVHEELAWDLLALRDAESVTDERVAAAGIPSPVAGFYPSLHLNLGEAYRKLGDLAASQRPRSGTSSSAAKQLAPCPTPATAA